MPQLPHYDEQRQLSTKTSQVQEDVSKAGQVAGAVGDLAGQVAEVTKHFADIKMANEKADAKIRASRSIAEMEQSIQENPAEWDTDKVASRLTEIGTESSEGITFEMGRADFSRDFQMTSIQTQANAGQALRNYQIQQYKANVALAVEDLYGSTNREAELNDLLAESRRVGLYANAEETEIEKRAILDEWQSRDIMNAAEKDPALALKLAEEIDNPEKKADAITKIKAIDAQQKEKARIAMHRTHVDNQNVLMEFLADGDVSYAEKARAVAEHEFAQTIPSEFATRANKWLNSVKKINAIENSDAVAEVIRLAYDAVESYKIRDANEGDFLESVSYIQDRILDHAQEGNLTEEAMTKLQQDVFSITKAKVAEATSGLRLEFEGARKADNIFMTAVHKGLRNEALRMYHEVTRGKEHSEESMMRIVNEIATSLKTHERTQVLKAMEAEGNPDVMQFVNPNTQEVAYFIVDKNNKPVKRIDINA